MTELWFDDVLPGAPPLSLNAGLVALNHLLGLPPLIRVVCHRYANACVCDGCMRRERQQAQPLARQPWEAAA